MTGKWVASLGMTFFIDFYLQGLILINVPPPSAEAVQWMEILQEIKGVAF